MIFRYFPTILGCLVENTELQNSIITLVNHQTGYIQGINNSICAKRV
jgi:hypothetical protein